MSNLTDCERVQPLVDNILKQRLNGEDPRNDTSPWERRAARGCDVFRDTARDVSDKFAMGHLTAAGALEILEICRQGIKAFMDLNDVEWEA